MKAAVLNPDHLLEQAEALNAPRGIDAPREVDMRRAISACYYSLFHAALAAAADLYVGASERSKARYALVYRSIEHQTLTRVCKEVIKPEPPPPYAAQAPQGSFDPALKDFATACVNAQEERHTADYAPTANFTEKDTRKKIEAAKAALASFRNASPESREAFVSLLLFAPRRRS